MNSYVIPFDKLGIRDVETVGGKNASLGEMIGALTKLGVRVPGGFATTAHAYREFLAQGGLSGRIAARLEALDPEDVDALARCGEEIRGWIEAALLEELAVGVRGGGEAARHLHAGARQRADHLAERGVLAADGLDVPHAQLLERDDVCTQGMLLTPVAACWRLASLRAR